MATTASSTKARPGADADTEYGGFDEDELQFIAGTRSSEPCLGPIHTNRVVYYLQRGNGDIKIGFTSGLGDRARRIRREHGPVVLLATEPGRWTEERRRHEEFAQHRADGEWFRPAPELLRHIDLLAQA